MAKSPLRERMLYITCFLIMAFVAAPLMGIAGLFVAPVAQSLGVSRSAVTGQMALAALACIFSSVAAGRIFTRYSIRPVVIVSTVVTALTYLGRAFAGLAGLYVLTVICAVFTLSASNIPISLLINNWRGSRSKGAVTAFVMGGMSVGCMLFNLLISYTNDIFGWRFSYLLIGAIIAVLVLPMVALFVHDHPADDSEPGQDSPAPPAQRWGITFAMAKGTAELRLFIALFLLLTVSTTVYDVNIVSYYTDLGFSAGKLAAILFASSCATLCGRFLIGAVFDRYGALSGMLGACITMLAGWCMVVAVGYSEAFYIPGSLGMSLGMGVSTIGVPILILHLFGDADYGTFMGWVSAATALAIAVGSMLGTVIFDLLGSYSYVWVAGTAMMCLVVIISVKLLGGRGGEAKGGQLPE